jgi:adenosine/AMP kinase
MFVPHWKHTPSRPVTGDSFSILYVDDVCTSLEAHAFTACYGIALLYVHSALNMRVVRVEGSQENLKNHDLKLRCLCFCP